MARTTTLFRFVALRPVQMVDEERAWPRFLRLPGDGPATDFQESIAGVDLAAGRALAAEYVATDRYRQAYERDDPELEVLHRIYSALREGRARGGVAEARDRVRPLRPRIPRGDDLEALRLVLWDALLAAFLSPATDPRDRAALVGPLRAIHFLDHRERLDQDRELDGLLVATAVVPVWVPGAGTEGAPEPEGEAEPDPGGEPEPGGIQRPGSEQSGGVETLASLTEEYRTTLAATTELVATDRRIRRATAHAARGGPPETIPQADPGEGRSRERAATARTRTVVLPSPADQDHAAKVASALTRETRALLDAVLPDWEHGSPAAARVALENRQARLHRAAFRIGGPDAALRLAPSSPLEGPLPGKEEEIPTPTLGPDFTRSITETVGTARVLGYGDLLIVEEGLLRYEEGELAHVENVLATESRERIHRRLDRTVETTYTSTEETQETERDLQSTSRFEVSSEAESTVSSASSVSGGVDISASYGPMVQVSTTADFAVESAREEAKSASQSYAQDIVDQTVTRIARTVREELTVEVLSEVEETNTHGFDNSGGSDHVVGMYRWLDKIYESGIFNYGRRLMLEFIVPEPSAFLRYARDEAREGEAGTTPPEPLPEDFGPLDVDPADYTTWVEAYHVPDVEPPPAPEVYVAKVLVQPETVHELESDDHIMTVQSDTIGIPAGYAATSLHVQGSYMVWFGPDFSPNLDVVAGDRTLHTSDGDQVDALDGVTEQLPVAVYAHDVGAYVLTAQVYCERLEETLRAWQLDTYEQIVQAHASQQEAYEAAVEAARSAAEATALTVPTESKRALEREELKKGCIQLLTDQHFYDFDATVGEADPYGYPEFVPRRALEEGSYVQYFEQLCEWEQMTYVFHPYFWGRKSEWVSTSTEADDDLTFEAFLRAGSARVVVPVRPGYERSLAYYLTYGEIWNGGETPVIGDPLYLSIVDEVVEGMGVSLEDAELYGDPWTYSVPTSLIRLQETPDLPTFPGLGLP